jgi:DNA polymerase III sliding clamp (beta) subunit (PCNA family)
MSFERFVQRLFGVPKPLVKRRPPVQLPPPTPRPQKAAKPVAAKPLPPVPAGRQGAKSPPVPAISQVKVTAMPEASHAKQLLDALQWASLVTEKRVSLPILECVRIGEGMLQATDLEIGLTVKLPWLELPPTCVSASRVQKALSIIRSEELRLDRREGVLVVNDSLTINTYPPEEWPAVHPGGTGRFCGPAFPVPERFADVLPALSPDETRLQLSGVFFDLVKLCVVTSDGHRLHLVKMDRPEPADRLTIPTKWEDLDQRWADRTIIPAKAAKLLAKMRKKGEVRGQFFLATNEPKQPEDDTPTTVTFHNGTVVLSARTVEGQFPDYGQVLGLHAQPTAVSFSTPELLAVMKLCVKMTPDRARGILIERVEGGAQISFRVPDEGEMKRGVSCTGWNGLPRAFGINCRYLKEALECVRTPTVTVLLNPTEEVCVHPMHWTDNGFRAVIMPMRVLDDIKTPVGQHHTDTAQLQKEEAEEKEAERQEVEEESVRSQIEDLEEDLAVLEQEIQETQDERQGTDDPAEEAGLKQQLTDLVENKRMVTEQLKKLYVAIGEEPEEEESHA